MNNEHTASTLAFVQILPWWSMEFRKTIFVSNFESLICVGITPPSHGRNKKDPFPRTKFLEIITPGNQVVRRQPLRQLTKELSFFVKVTDRTINRKHLSLSCLHKIFD